MLRQKNISYLFGANPKLLEEISVDSFEASINQKLSNYPIDSAREWSLRPDKSIALPGYLPSSPSVISKWRELYPAVFPANINQYFDIHEEVHLYQLLCEVYEELLAIEVDPADNTIQIFPNCALLIAFGTGSGTCLLELVQALRPRKILIFVTDWIDFGTSFDVIDWPQLWSEYENQIGYSISITRVKTDVEALAVAAKASILSLDNAYVYTSPVSEKNLQRVRDIFYSESLPNLIHYLGYTVDEFNMIVNSVSTLAKGPKQYLKPSRPFDGRAIVCGSGPSLDENIDIIRELSSSHMIICGGSNIRTLLKNDIRVDILALVERDQSVFDVYKELAAEHDLSDVLLVMSCTCYQRLLELFDESAVFFRPSLTPVALFSQSSAEILDFDGPEAVNAAFGIACALGFSQIALFGVDLGSKKPDQDRSRDAADYSIRTWDREEPGNYGEPINTNKMMIDVKISLEMAILAFGSRSEVFNCSDGLLIDGAKPMQPASYVQSYSEGTNELTHYNFEQWKKSLYSYTNSEIKARLEARRIRANTHALLSRIESLMDSQTPWFYDVLYQIQDILELRGSQESQVPVRVVRSTIYKAVLVCTQRMQVLRKGDPDSFNKFCGFSRNMVKKYCARLRTEIFDLCDMIESELGAL